MQVILLERVAKLGQMGDGVDVKPGYARNFLLPQGKALRANGNGKIAGASRRFDTRFFPGGRISCADGDRALSGCSGMAANSCRPSFRRFSRTSHRNRTFARGIAGEAESNRTYA